MWQNPFSTHDFVGCTSVEINISYYFACTTRSSTYDLALFSDCSLPSFSVVLVEASKQPSRSTAVAVHIYHFHLCQKVTYCVCLLTHHPRVHQVLSLLSFDLHHALLRTYTDMESSRKSLELRLHVFPTTSHDRIASRPLQPQPLGLPHPTAPSTPPPRPKGCALPASSPTVPPPLAVGRTASAAPDLPPRRQLQSTLLQAPPCQTGVAHQRSRYGSHTAVVRCGLPPAAVTDP